MTFLIVIWVRVWKFPNQFNTIILPHKCKLFFQWVFLPLSSLNSIPVPLMFREGCQHLFITTKQRTSCHYAIQIARSRTFCSLPPSLLFRITGKGRATSTCWLQNHRCFPPPPPPSKANHLLGTTSFSHMSCYQFLLLLLFFLVLIFVSSPLPPIQSINFNDEISCSAKFVMDT